LIMLKKHKVDGVMKPIIAIEVCRCKRLIVFLFTKIFYQHYSTTKNHVLTARRTLSD
jgi:hypothetical protein